MKNQNIWEIINNMMENKYALAYSEVLEILKYVNIEDFNKIPKSKIKLFEKYRDKQYMFCYDINKTLNEQNVSEITKGILILLFRDYWANEIQREKIIKKQNYDRIKLEEEKREKYNPDSIFKSREIKYTEIPTSNITSMIEYKESVFKRVIDKIKSIFAKK